MKYTITYTALYRCEAENKQEAFDNWGDADLGEGEEFETTDIQEDITN